MFKPILRTYFCLTGILVLITGSPLFGQGADLKLQQVESEAMTRLEGGDYSSALSGFKTLMDADPDNADYPYYAGICLVELNEDLDDAIEYLYEAANGHSHPDAKYYLGRAYHRNYNFSEAQKYYSQFGGATSRSESKNYQIPHLLETTRSAKEITASYNPFEVMNVTFIDLFDSLQFSQIKMKGGQMQRKPGAYFQADEDRHGLSSLVFVPRNAVRGDYLYFSGYNRNQKGGAQLYRIKKGAGKSWGDPEEIKSLNSEGDELLPYFDPIENDLYFASDGRLGVGGFDLYRSHYDLERDIWSEPINLGFPVNSAMDEYLLLPGSDLGMVMFFSNREGTDSTVTVYRVHLAEPKKEIHPNDHKMRKEIASLGGVAGEILAEMEEVKAKEMERERAKALAAESLADSLMPAPPVLTEVTVLSQKSIDSEHKYMLKKALGHQANSDSLNNLASNARFLIADSDDPNDRWVWQKQIMLWEKRARDEEALADELYQKMEEERLAINEFYAGTIPETIEVDTVMGDLTVYRYTGITSTQTKEASMIPKADPPPPVIPAKAAFVPSTPEEFELRDHSPYHSENPIPMDVPLPAGICYMIQIGVLGSPAEPDAFGGLSPITGMHIEKRGIWKYYAGKFSKYDHAFEALALIRTRDFKDAFIVAWNNGRIVSTQEAKELE